MAGLLDFLSSDDAKLGLGLLAAAGPSTQPMNAFQRIQMAQQGLSADKQGALKLKLLESQIEENKTQDALRRAQAEFDQQFMGMGGAPGGGAASPSGGGAAPGAVGGMTARDIAQRYNIPLEAVVADRRFNGGKKIAELISERSKPNWQNVNGNLVNTNAEGFQGGIQDGVFAGPDGRVTMVRGNGGNPVTGALPGSMATYQAFEDIKNRSSAGVKPGKAFNPATGREEYVPGGELALTQGRGDPLTEAVRTTESGGNVNAVSPKGAMGDMQVMPGTNTAPGFGVAPARDGSQGERTRVGEQYLKAMNERYQNPTLAAIAYNWGPGNTDMWLKSGGDFNKLPAETKQYVSAVMTRAAVNGRAPQSGNLAAGPSIDEKRLADSAETFGKETAKTDAEQLGKWRGAAEAGNSMLNTAQSLRNSVSQGVFSGGGAQAKTAVAGMINGLTGVTLKSLPGSELFNAEASKLILDSIKALGTNPSNADREFLSKTIPDLERSPQARDALIGFLEKKGREAVDLYKRADTHARANNGLGGFDQFAKQKTVVKTGVYGGKKVVQYSDGSVDYAN